MDTETFLGAILIAAWAALVLRGLTRTTLAARKRSKWERAYLVGLGVGCALGVGVVLFNKNSLPLDTFTIGFLLAAVLDLRSGPLVEIHLCRGGAACRGQV